MNSKFLISKKGLLYSESLTKRATPFDQYTASDPNRAANPERRQRAASAGRGDGDGRQAYRLHSASQPDLGHAATPSI